MMKERLLVGIYKSPDAPPPTDNFEDVILGPNCRPEKATTAGLAEKDEGIGTSHGRPGNGHERLLGGAALADQLTGGTNGCL